MIEEYKIVFKGGIGEITEKKSRFIAVIRPVSAEEEALAFIEEMKKKYWDASHHCFAFVIGDRNQIQRCGDDGEPSQTAGRPMLEVLMGEKVHNVCAVVIRYFGGTLLGTGGLVRAYSKAVQEGLSQTAIVTKYLAQRLKVTTDYNGLGKIQYLAGQMGIKTLESEYSDTVTLILLVPVRALDALITQITECTNGKSKIQKTGELFYGIVDHQVHIF